VRRIAPALGLLAVSLLPADANLESLLKGVESRYNRAKTLQVLFKEEYTPAGGMRRSESGILMLRKPGRMRWMYSQPPGKFFLSDSKSLYLYNPEENRVEQMKVQETEDMRAPLAFLLGQLNFQIEFRNLQARPEGAGTRITGESKGENLPYSQVEFVVTADYRIREVKVTGYDRSITDFTFDQERIDPTLDPKLFQLQMPQGAELVKAGH
jgi:outer membrane lipoprotein carrier protein